MNIFGNSSKPMKLFENPCKSTKPRKFVKIHKKIGTEHPRNQASKHAKFDSFLSGTTILPAMRFNILSSSHRVLEKSAAETATCK